MSVTIKNSTPIRDQFAVRILASRNERPYLMGDKMLPTLAGTGEGGKS